MRSLGTATTYPAMLFQYFVFEVDDTKKRNHLINFVDDDIHILTTSL